MGGWAVGSSRETMINWTLDARSVPEGHHCLVAWVDLPSDPVLNAAAVTWDDNRAQRNITFVLAPAAGAPATAVFWVNPQESVERRDITVNFGRGPSSLTFRRLARHVGPGLMCEQVIGGKVLGGYKGDQPIEPDRLDPKSACRDAVLTGKAAEGRDCTVVIGQLDSRGRLRLEGIRVTQPTRMTLQVWMDREGNLSQPADIEVTEAGVSKGHEEASPIGGLTLRFERKVRGKSEKDR